MPRNAVAVWLKAVFMIASVPPLFGWAPIPLSLQSASAWYARATLILIVVGCFVSLVGIFWRDRLDGGVIEQLGLSVLVVGVGLFVVALLRTSPVGWFGAVTYAGLSVAFIIQWLSIYRFRKSLRPVEYSHG